MTNSRRLFLTTLLVLGSSRPVVAQSVDSLLRAEKARNVFRKHCTVCHAGLQARGGLDVLDYARLVPVLTPGKPETSELLQLVECGSMPRGTRPKVPTDEVTILRDWIAGGAPPFALETSDEYVLRQILLDVRTADARRDPARERYFTFNHLRGAPEADPELFREALTRAVNLLSWQKGIVKPTVIDSAGTIFRVDLGDLGWDTTPYPGSPVNLFDLILLEYPHAVVPLRSPLYEELEREYLQKAAPVRPVAFVRGDWFVSAAGRSPLYEDLLRLPLKIDTLENKLGLAKTEPARGLLINSNVLRASRLLESRTTLGRVYWRTYDNALIIPQGAGEMLFSLPNGLPGFFVAGKDGHRDHEVADDLLKEEVPKKDRPMRNGLLCARCHSSGLVKPTDTNAAALERLNVQLAADNGRFAAALATLSGKLPARDPLAIMDRLYRSPALRPPNADETPVPPLDGLTHPDRRRAEPLKVELSAFDFATKEKASVFKPGDKMYLEVKNSGSADVWIELVATGRDGNVQVIPVPVKLEKDKEVRFPPGDDTLPIGDDVGKNYLTLYVSDQAFLPGGLLTMNAPNSADYVADRFVHPFPKKRGAEDGAFGRIEKRSIEIETRAK